MRTSVISVSLVIAVLVGYGHARSTSAYPTPGLHARQHPNTGALSGQGTQLNKISARGDIAGWYTDNRNLDHGFLLHPSHGPDRSCDDQGYVSGSLRAIAPR